MNTAFQIDTIEVPFKWRMAMHKSFFALMFCSSLSCMAENLPKLAPNDIQFPIDYKNWQLVGVSHRTDNNSLRVILGNSIAIQAIKDNKINPWPNGAILGKLVWKDSQHANWQQATVPQNLLHVEFMVKDAKKFNKTGGWGYARWLGNQLTPFGEDKSFAQACYVCHQRVKSKDYVFTHPVQLP